MVEDGYLYESEFTLCVRFVRCSVEPRAVWSSYLEAGFLGISYIPAAALCRVSLRMRVDHCSVSSHRKSGCGHAHCCRYPCFGAMIKCGDWIGPLIFDRVTAANLLFWELGSWGSLIGFAIRRWVELPRNRGSILGKGLNRRGISIR
jgi:hypothetical protein